MNNVLILAPPYAGAKVFAKHYAETHSYYNTGAHIIYSVDELERTWGKQNTVTKFIPSLKQKNKEIEHWCLKNATEVIIIENENKEQQVKSMYLSRTNLELVKDYTVSLDNTPKLIDCVATLKKNYNVVQHYIDNYLTDTKKTIIYSNYDKATHSLVVDSTTDKYHYYIKEKGMCGDLIRDGGLQWHRTLKI